MQTYKLADWLDRVLATLVDGLVLSVLWAGCYFAATQTTGTLLWGILVASLSVQLNYHVMLPARRGERNGQTIGKQLMGIRIVRDNGQPATMNSGWVRELARLVIACIPIVNTLNLILPRLDPEKRTIHDIVAKTHVVSSEQVNPFHPQAFSPGGDAGRIEAAKQHMAARAAAYEAANVTTKLHTLDDLAVGRGGYGSAAALTVAQDGSAWIGDGTALSGQVNAAQQVRFECREDGLHAFMTEATYATLKRSNVAAASYASLGGWRPVQVHAPVLPSAL